MQRLWVCIEFARLCIIYISNIFTFNPKKRGNIGLVCAAKLWYFVWDDKHINYIKKIKHTIRAFSVLYYGTKLIGILRILRDIL